MEEEEILEAEMIETGMTQERVNSVVRRAIEDAVDFIEGEIGPQRVKAQKYFDGRIDIEHEPGRSKVVVTRVRDIVRAIKPSLMRVFLSSSRFVEYIPRGPEDVPFASQATEYMHWKFQELGGFKLLSDAFHDALVKKTGIVKVWWEDTEESTVHTFTNLNDLQYQALIYDPDVDILEHSEMIEGSMMDGMMTMPEVRHSLKVAKRQRRGQMKVESVPPEEFFIDRNARSIEDCYVCGHRTDMRVGDLVAMGYDQETVSQLQSTADELGLEEEAIARKKYAINVDETEDPDDPSMRKVMVTEAYMRMDVDGSGVPALHRFILGGDKYQLLDVEPADEIPFAIFEVDPEPHTFFGRSIPDLINDDQDAASAIMRGILDNVQMVNNPRLVVVERNVEVDDLVNNEIGSIIRASDPGAVTPLAIPAVALQTLTALQYLDGQVESKTGVSKASMGLDPDAMQSTTRAAVNATVQAAAGQVETMARNLAEGGMKRLFTIMLKLLVKNSDGNEMMRLNGGFQPIDPRVWNTLMDVSVNVGLGTGREEEKAQVYREVLQFQSQILQAYGVANPMVKPSNLRNTLADMLAAAGIRNSDRYFAPIGPEVDQMLAQQAQQPQQPQSDPAQAIIMGEQIKAETQLQANMAKLQLEAQKAVMEDDRERDKMLQDLALKVAEILAKYGVQVDAGQVIAGQMAPRGIA